jgi:ubiquinone/menaquinone biosynthesis C-methylase UbiE
MTEQKEAFLQYEANRWFERNKAVLTTYEATNDKIITLLQDYKISPQNVLEIGCSAGYRLDGFLRTFNKVKVYGIEPSNEAIEYGKMHYPDVHFSHGTVDNMSQFEDETFDVVIVGFVFYVVDRKLLLKSISEIDRVLKNKGFLVVLDFFSETAVKRSYQHINEFSAYSFKQRYDEVFTATQIYHLISRSCYNHDTSSLDALADFQNMYSLSLLRKDLDASYK